MMPETTNAQAELDLSILVVDDERPITDTLCKILQRAGYKCRGAYSAAEALDVLQEFVPTLVITDVMMPDVNGVEMAKIIFKQYPTSKILIFSGNAATQDLLESARAEGFTFDVMAKPLHPRELLAKVSMLLKSPK